MNSALARFLVHDLRHDAATVVEAVAQLGIAVDEHPLPRHQHVIEDDHRVGLVEARGERIVHRRGGVLVDYRGAADKAQTGCVDLDAEAESVRLGFLAVGDVGRRQNEKVVGIGAQGRHHAGTANDDPGTGLLDDLRRQILVLLFDRPRAVDLRVDQGMGHANVILADMLVVAADVLGEALVFLAEFFGRRGEAGDEYVHVIGVAPKHSAGRIRPNPHHVPAPDQIVNRARLDKRESDALTTGRREKRHPVDQRRIVLHVVELSEAPRRRGKARIGRDVPYPVAVDKHLAAVP